MKAEQANDQKIATVVQVAGGAITGRVRLQKIMYLLQLAGCESGFDFDYHHYGPYSEDVTAAASLAVAKGTIKEEERTASWGGRYSVYRSSGVDDSGSVDSVESELVQKAAHSSSIELELAATAAYFAVKENPDPWAETQSRKPEKATDERVKSAKQLYAELYNIANKSPANKLPNLV